MVRLPLPNEEEERVLRQSFKSRCDVEVLLCFLNIIDVCTKVDEGQTRETLY